MTTITTVFVRLLRSFDILTLKKNDVHRNKINNIRRETHFATSIRHMVMSGTISHPSPYLIKANYDILK